MRLPWSNSTQSPQEKWKKSMSVKAKRWKQDNRF